MPRETSAAVADAELAGRIARHDHTAFEALMRRHNRRLFRVTRNLSLNRLHHPIVR